MDLLMECASVFKNLMNYQYRFTLGRKGTLKEILLEFSETDFHHLVGLHKLRDTEVARANRSMVFRDIIAGRITYDTIMKSDFIEEISSRLQAFPNLENLLDHDQLVFRYNKKIYPYSSIESEFLLKMGDGTILDITFLFLDQAEQGIYYCRSFFPFERTDYTKGQMQYTLLKKEKIDTRTGAVTVQYDRLTPKKNTMPRGTVLFLVSVPALSIYFVTVHFNRASAILSYTRSMESVISSGWFYFFFVIMYITTAVITITKTIAAIKNIRSTFKAVCVISISLLNYTIIIYHLNINSDLQGSIVL